MSGKRARRKPSRGTAWREPRGSIERVERERGGTKRQSEGSRVERRRREREWREPRERRESRARRCGESQTTRGAREMHGERVEAREERA
eukprot:962714-Rhodomonas_salina.1